MELNDSFEVAHPIAEVWEVLTDVERIAPCLPGAQLTGSDGDTYQGLVKVRVGPITSQYNGTAAFTERDDDAHRLLMSASGRDTRGAGNASAKITVALESVSDTVTTVSVHTDLKITGKVAQFGRGVLADVSRKLMAQFADNLAELVAADTADEAGGDSDEPADGTAAGDEAGRQEAESSAPVADEAQEVEAVDLLSVAGAPLLKRLVPVILAVILVLIVVIVILAA